MRKIWQRCRPKASLLNLNIISATVYTFILSFFIFSIPLLYSKGPEGLKFSPLSFDPPKVEQRILSYGTTVYLLPDPELPLIQMTVFIKTGSMYEPQEQVGLSSLMATLLRNGGTKRNSAEQIDQELEEKGAVIETGMDTEVGNASLSILSKDLDRGLELLFEMLQFPQFDKQKCAIEKAKAIESIRRRNDEPFAIARREVRKILYGPTHPLSRTTEIPVIKKISRKDLIEFHKKYYFPSNMSFAISGDFKSEDLIKKLELLLEGWRNKDVQFPGVPTVPLNNSKVHQRKVGLAEKSLSQASVILAQLGIKRHNPDRFALEVMNEILGGSAFTSRLYKEIRSRRGLVYWIGSNFSEPWDTGTIGIGCQTKNKTVGEVIETIHSIAEEIIQTPVPEEELKAAKDAIINSFIFRYSSSHAIVTQKMNLEYFGYSPDYLETYTEKISQITSKEVQKVAKKYLKPKEMAIMVIGNSKEFEPSLDRWGQIQKIDLKIDE